MDITQQEQDGVQESTQEQQQGGENKIAKKFDAAMNNLTAMLKGNTSLFKKPKVKSSDLGAIIEELLKDRTEAAMKNFKVEAITLIDEKIAFDKFVLQKQKEFEDVVLKKKEELTKKANGVFSMLEDVNKMAADYRATLNGGSQAS